MNATVSYCVICLINYVHYMLTVVNRKTVSEILTDITLCWGVKITQHQIRLVLNTMKRFTRKYSYNCDHHLVKFNSIFTKKHNYL